jgi:negative regulator of flagellin synthesis FlgM
MMKIDGNSGPQDTKATDGTRRTGGVDGGSKRVADSKAAVGTDRVELSSDAALVSAALKAANAAPDIRADKVQEMRAKLAEGKVGNDARQLADAIIDDLLK